MVRRDGSSGISPLLDILVNPDTPLAKMRRVLETLTFLAANPAIAYSICEQGGIALLLQIVADPNDGVQLEAAEALQALMVHQCAQVWVAVTWLGSAMAMISPERSEVCQCTCLLKSKLHVCSCNVHS